MLTGSLDEVGEGEKGLFGQRLAVGEDAPRLGVADDPLPRGLEQTLGDLVAELLVHQLERQQCEPESIVLCVSIRR